MDFMKSMENNVMNTTTNGAVQYATSSSKLVDMNFEIPEMRAEAQTESERPYWRFVDAYNEDAELAIRWLLFLRDVRGGAGERASFRSIMLAICNNEAELAKAILNTVNLAEYGRWDDVVYLACNCENSEIASILYTILYKQFTEDMLNASSNKNVSLLGKWLPSENATSLITKHNATKLRVAFGLTSKQYRKGLSLLRNKINIVETNLAQQTYDKINYAAVPSKANVLYREAFLRHDNVRRQQYLEDVKQGVQKMNAKAMFLYDIVAQYDPKIDYNDSITVDDTLEMAWQNVKREDTFTNTLMVRDGSGSMYCPVQDDSNISCLTLADALTIYCAEQTAGVFHDKFISFSARPRVVDLSNKKTLGEKLSYLRQYDDCDTTNVEAVFDLILCTAVKEHMKQEDMPQRVVIVSDMQFNSALDSDSNDEALFETIAKKFEAEGYKLPTLVFWNCSAYGEHGVPMQQNDNGVVLMSGFSTDLLKFILANEYNPLETLKKVLNVERYDVAKDVLASLQSS